MLFSSLTHGGPSAKILQEWVHMHQHKAPSYLRDADGILLSQWSPLDKRLDAGAKALGALSQFIQRYHLLNVVTSPLVQPVIAVRRAAALRAPGTSSMPLILSALKGIFYEGLVQGGLRSLASPG